VEAVATSSDSVVARRGDVTGKATTVGRGGGKLSVTGGDTSFSNTSSPAATETTDDENERFDRKAAGDVDET